MRIDFHSIERHIINKNNMQDYILILPKMIKQSSNLIEFHLDSNELILLFKSIGFEKISDDSLTYTNNQGCILYLSFPIVDGLFQNYYIFQEIVFNENEIYKEGFRITYNTSGIPVRVVFSQKIILKSLKLIAIDYDIDKKNLQIATITYRFDDGRKYQKCINGCIYAITERPIKRVNDDGLVLENISIYDVTYLRPRSRTNSTLSLSDIITDCSFSSSKLLGTDYTQFLQTYKMFNKREQAIIAMTYI